LRRDAVDKILKSEGMMVLKAEVNEDAGRAFFNYRQVLFYKAHWLRCFSFSKK